jgi:Fumarylacetoacetate (FAA) hydrolase family
MTKSYVFDPPTPPTVAVAGEVGRFPVRRIFCVGRNYAAHAREMGKDPDREPPFFFTKQADAVVDSGAIVPYPPETSDFQYEIELVVAIGREGFDVSREAALDLVFGYGLGIDLTRRDAVGSEGQGASLGLGQGVRSVGAARAAAPYERRMAPGRGPYLARRQRCCEVGCGPGRIGLAGGRHCLDPVALHGAQTR